jgi:hypothetical protein
MANSRQRKSPSARLAGYKAAFRKTSRNGVYYERGTPPSYAKYFTLDRYKRNVVLRSRWTREKILADVGGRPFHRQGISTQRQTEKSRYVDKQLERDAKKAEREGRFDPKNIKDGREKAFHAITLRRGRLGFRRKLLEVYSRHCAVTKCDCPDGLEAAHILPYRGDDTNHVQNGILLRSDIHTLFDLGKIGFAPISHKVIVSKLLKGTVYGKLEGKTLRLPRQPNERPNEDALRQHLRRSGL